MQTRVTRLLLTNQTPHLVAQAIISVLFGLASTIATPLLDLGLLLLFVVPIALEMALEGNQFALVNHDAVAAEIHHQATRNVLHGRADNSQRTTQVLLELLADVGNLITLLEPVEMHVLSFLN